ncbi:hypothetical protein [Ornithinibacillus xuwenensis]|uniref:DUF4179 domain-containing protein n=1 Tax=Ornithinibacillus xuwenensis TaxID=3144668 RepID=A0ABU9XIT2_9BACI
MKQYEKMNQAFQSLNQKFDLPEQEQKEILLKINERMNDTKPIKKRGSFQWKYILASAATIVLLIITSIAFMTSPNKELVQEQDTNPDSGTNASTGNLTGEGVTIHITNNTTVNIDMMMVKIYQDGSMSTSQGGMNADGSAIVPGDGLDFQFLDEEIGEGDLELEVELTYPSNEEGVSSFVTPRITLSETDEGKYSLQLKGDTESNIYLLDEAIFAGITTNNTSVGIAREKIELGLTKSEVENLFWEDYKKGTSDVDNREFWRYDLDTSIGYPSSDDNYENGDIEAIKNGDIQAQVFIYWDEDNQVKNYSAIYLDQDNHHVYAYHLLSDGSEKLELVQKK